MLVLLFVNFCFAFILPEFAYTAGFVDSAGDASGGPTNTYHMSHRIT